MITFKKIISVFLCIVITLSVCSVDFGIVSQAIEKTAGMAELSAFEGENAEITKSKNSEQFAELVGELVEENWEDNYFSEIVVDKNNVVNVDGVQTQQSVSDVVENGVNENVTVDSEEKYSIPVESELSDLGCVVEYEDDYIRVTKPFQTKRLILNSSEKKLSNTYGASEIITDGKGKYILQYDNEQIAEKAFNYLSEEETTESVSVDRVVKIATVPTTEEHPLLQEERNRWGAERIESDRFKQYLSDKGKNNKIVVAVIDTGVQADHPFLEGRILDNGYDFIHNDNMPDDENMHGTHCAGIIADNTPECVKILPVKIFNSTGSSTSAIISLGIDYAVRKNADVISMSFGGYCSDTACEIEASVNKAIKKGITCVVAAGNEWENAKDHCPSKIEECITVASLDKNDRLSDFSNFGDVVDISAPGEDIWSSSIAENGYYEPASGTSMACPFVAAASAMFLVNDPALTPDEVQTKIKNTAVDLGVKGEDATFGAGALDFGIFFNDSIKATTISIEKEAINLYLSKSIEFDAVPVTVTVGPEDATDKSYMVKIKDTGISSFDGFGFVGKKTGETTATFTLANGTSETITIKCKNRTFWVDYPADSFEGGNGSQNNPYLVKTAKQLARISYLGKNNKLKNDIYFKQVADIDLSGKNWYPIKGTDQDSYISRINYDGNGYDIKNLHISNINQDMFLDYAALFACTTGQLKNINMIDVNINAADSSFAAPICGYFGGVMKNCYANGKVKGSASGGLVASFATINGTSSNIIISNCRSDVSVNGVCAGGITAFFAAGQIENCIFTGSLYSPDDCIGGIVASVSPHDSKTNYDYLLNNVKIINCVSTENICNSAEKTEENGTVMKPYISNCYYSGEYDSAVENYSDGDITLRKTSKVDGKSFKDASFYSEKGRWDEERPWNVGKTWKVNKSYPEISDQKDKIVLSQFNYFELRDRIVVNGYTGKNPNITIPSKINGKYVRAIGDNFTSKYVDIVSIKLPDSLRTISSMAFAYDRGRVKDSLVKIDLGDGVKHIDAGAFNMCSQLACISIPKSIKTLDASVFENSNVKYVFFEGDAENINPRAFGVKNPAKAGVKIYRKKGTSGWGSSKLEYFKAKAYSPKVPIIVRGNNDTETTYVKYGSKSKLKCTVYPESASSAKLTYKSSNSLIKVSSSGYVTTTTKGREDSIITVYYNGKKIGTLQADTLVSANNYTVKFSGYNATSGSMKPQEINYYASTKLRDNEFKKKGYTFMGWSTTKGSKIIALKDEERACKLAKRGKTEVLYAIWQANEYNIKFNANGGSGSMSAIKGVDYNKSQKLPSCSFTAPEGKVFAGWAKSKTGSVVYKNKASVKNLTSKDGKTVTLYAVWKNA